MSIPSIHDESASALLNRVDITFECIRSLETCQVEGWKSWRICWYKFVYILLQKLDASTKVWFEREFG